MNSKGFSLIEMLAVMIILVILFTLANFGYINYLNSSRDKSFRIAVNSFEDATATALEDCESGSINNFCTKYNGIPSPGERITISLEELVNSSYIDNIRNPYDTSEICEGSIVVERVKVDKIEHTIKNSDGTTTKEILEGDDSNIELKYETCLICGTHQSDKCG